MQARQVDFQLSRSILRLFSPTVPNSPAMLSRLSVRPSSLQLPRRMATQRISMVSQHLSTSSSSSAAPAASGGATRTPNGGGDASAPVLFEAEHSLRRIVLNRAKALNSLNDEMVDLILPQLSKFEQSDLANVVVIKSNSKHFCAGGDVVCESRAPSPPPLPPSSRETRHLAHSALVASQLSPSL